jgi:hypothetical protein
VDAELPHIAWVRDLARRAVIYGKHLESGGKPGEDSQVAAARVYLDVIRMGLHLDRGGKSLIELLAATSVSYIGCSALEAQLARGCGARANAFILKSLASMPPPRFDLARVIRCEKDLVSASLKKKVAIKGPEVPVLQIVLLNNLARPEACEVEAWDKAIGAAGGQELVEDAVDEYRKGMDRLVAACAAKSYARVAERTAAIEKNAAQVLKASTGREAAARMVARHGPGRAIGMLWASMMCPAASKVHSTCARAEARLRALEVLAAACVERAGSGKYPVRLSDFAAHFPQGLPRDPFTGKAFGYRLEAGLPAVVFGGEVAPREKWPAGSNVLGLARARRKEQEVLKRWRAGGGEDGGRGK